MPARPYLPPRAEILVAVFALLLSLAAQAAESWTLSAAEWSRPRSGAAVLEMAPVAEAVRAWQAAVDEHAGARLLLVHAGGEEGSLWAAELRDWLITLGVPPEAIELVPGAQSARALELRLLQ